MDKVTALLTSAGMDPGATRLDMAQFSEATGLSNQNIRELLRRGVLVGLRVSTRRVYFTREQVALYLEQQNSRVQAA